MMSTDYATHDPDIHAALKLVQQGTNYFERTLAALSDDHLTGLSLLPRWNRRHVIAHVAYNAQALNRLVESAKTGIDNRMYASPEARNEQIGKGATLPAPELRELCLKSSEELDAGWQSLDDSAWKAKVPFREGVTIPATATIWLRTREVWLHAVDLDSGAAFDDFPAELVDHLLGNVLSVWRGRQAEEGIPNFVLAPTDRGVPLAVGDPAGEDSITLRGTAVDLTRWATGRGFLGVIEESGAAVPLAPQWI